MRSVNVLLTKVFEFSLDRLFCENARKTARLAFLDDLESWSKLPEQACHRDVLASWIESKRELILASLSASPGEESIYVALAVNHGSFSFLVDRYD